VQHWYDLGTHPAGTQIRLTGSEMIDSLMSIRLIRTEPGFPVVQVGVVPELGGCVSSSVFGLPRQWFAGVWGFDPADPPRHYSIHWGIGFCPGPEPSEEEFGNDLLVLWDDGTSHRMRRAFDPLAPDLLILTDVEEVSESWTELAVTGQIEPD